MKQYVVLPAVILIGLMSGAFVAKQTVGQRGRAFSRDSIAVKTGESIAFLNDDTVPHNIASISKGNEFNLGSQPPGASTEVVFTEAGEVQVFCAIHPRMKLTVTVSD
jgi:plastocyanin